MADNDFFEIPGASGDNSGGEQGQGASESAPADRNTILEQRLERMGHAIETLVSKDKTSHQQREKEQLQRKVVNAVRTKESEVDKAETALAEAYEEGDGVSIAKAQRKLSSLTAEVERLKAEGRAALERFESSQPRDDADDSDLSTANLDRWKDRNSSWYGVDGEMTRAAHKIDAEIRAAGQIETGSEAYFEAIDRQLSKQFPDKMRGSPGSAGGGGDTGGQNRGVTRIPADVADGWRRMGIDIDNPEVAKRMMDHRQKAVGKGILQEKPQFGRVLERR